jgi:hypothetical protein
MLSVEVQWDLVVYVPDMMCCMGQAREYLHFRLTGRQHLTPVAIMTSDAKGNHHRMLKLMKEHNWFGRGKESFR